MQRITINVSEKHLLHLENVPTSLPPKDVDRASPQMNDDETTLVALKDGKVQFGNMGRRKTVNILA